MDYIQYWAELIHHWDLELLHRMSSQWVSPEADAFFTFITNFHKNTTYSIPVFVTIASLLIYIDVKRALILLLTLILAVSLSDLISYRIIKKNFSRERPGSHLQTADREYRLIGIAHGPSFPSNHAANSFAAATVFAGFYRRRRKLFYIIAGLIGYSRIYLGVHYPSDVVVGALLGICIGMFCLMFMEWIISRIRLRRSISRDS